MMNPSFIELERREESSHVIVFRLYILTIVYSRPQPIQKFVMSFSEGGGGP